MPRKSLAACLIVKNEETHLPGCLASVRPFVDEIVVYDTGSTDTTIEVAKLLGVKVVLGWWDDDFAAARNRALEHVGCEWVISIDADELLEGDPSELRSRIDSFQNENLLSLTVRYKCADEIGGDYDSPVIRIFRRASSSWRGQIHEELIENVASPHAPRALDFEVAHILDLSYQDSKSIAAKATRNIAICEKELATLVRSHASDLDFYRLKLQLARSLIGANRSDDAIDALLEIKENLSEGIIWQIATEFLARIYLGRGHAEEVISLAQELRTASPFTQYADWLAAQAWVKLGGFDQAYRLVAPLSLLIDSQMHNYGTGRLEETKGLICGLSNRVDEAVDHLWSAIFDHGLASGNLGILFGLVRESHPGKFDRLLKLAKDRFPEEFELISGQGKG